eukprot:1764075-Prorocentrum_lima.AAC.1
MDRMAARLALERAFTAWLVKGLATESVDRDLVEMNHPPAADAEVAVATATPTIKVCAADRTQQLG